MADDILLEIVTPERASFNERVLDVVVPGEAGELDIFPGHLPLVTLLRPGQVRATTNTGVRYFAVGSGYAEILPGKVSLLVGECDGVTEIDIQRARNELSDAEKEMHEAEFVSDEDLAHRREKLERARARMSVAELATGTKH